jgi:hypothetical protein
VGEAGPGHWATPFPGVPCVMLVDRTDGRDEAAGRWQENGES